MKSLTVKIIGTYLDAMAYIAPSTAARHGFLLFCRPLRLPLNEKQLAFFQTSEQFTFSHEGIDVQAYRWGSGPKKIILLHGWQSHSYRWKPYVEALSKDAYTIYSLDAPGHGLSPGSFLSVPLYSSVIESFIKHEGPIHAAVAHSVGGFSLMYTFYRQPNLPVDKVILLAPPGEANDFIASFKRTLNISERTVALVIKHFAERYQVTPDYFSAQKFAEHMDVNGLIIHDEEDTDAPFHYSLPLHKTWKRSKLITTKGYGHNLKSPSVIRQVVDFIQDTVHEHSV